MKVKAHEIAKVRDQRLYSVEEFPGVYVVTEGESDEITKAVASGSEDEVKVWFTRWVYDHGPMWERIAQGEREP